MSLVMMNLVLGLAVSDISELEKVSKVGQVKSGQVRSSQVKSGQVRSSQVKSGLSQVNCY